MKRLFLIVLLCWIFTEVRACLIVVLSDGNEVLVGNHEDWFDQNAAIRVFEKTTERYGSVVFTFEKEGWAQGGMNDQGLFFDGTYTPFQGIDYQKGSKDFPGYIWQAVLDNCKNIEEALRFIQPYQLKDLEEAHIVLADASGESVVLGVENNQVAIKHNRGGHLVQTNFNPWHPELSEDAVCWRYQKSQEMLRKHAGVSVQNVKNVLEATHQGNLTVYSNIYDLKNKAIRVYLQHNFESEILLDVVALVGAGNCTYTLKEVQRLGLEESTCKTLEKQRIKIVGKVVDAFSAKNLPYVGVGFENESMGTLTDPDGSFELEIDPNKMYDSLTLVLLGYKKQKIRAKDLLEEGTVQLVEEKFLLEEVEIVDRKRTKRARIGWMKGRDGMLPFDTLAGGGMVAMEVNFPETPVFIEKVMVRLMYNSKDTLRFRFHILVPNAAMDGPGDEILTKEIILEKEQKYGWLRFDMEKYGLETRYKKVYIAFEWMEDRATREKMMEGFKAWEKWKKQEYVRGNSKLERMVLERPDGSKKEYLKYHGNMMNWPGWPNFPPFTGLMVETGKSKKTEKFKTYRKSSVFGPWQEVSNTLNAVVVVAY